MAKKIQVELEAKTDKAIKEIKDVKGEIQNLTKSTEEGFKDVGDATKGVSKGIKGIGTALKAAGIGLVIAAFAKLTEIFKQNQKVADLFNTAFEFTSIAFNDFVNLIVNNFSKINNFMKSLFSDPLQSAKDLGNAIKQNIIERFNSLLDTLGHAGTAIKKFFQGDFAGAAEAGRKAGAEFVDVLTGVDNSAEKISNTVKKAASATDQLAGFVQKTGTTSWSVPTSLDIDGASDGDVALAPGKSWGTVGWGMSNGKTAKADTTSSSSNSIGETFSRLDLQSSTAGTCQKHYMLV